MSSAARQKRFDRAQMRVLFHVPFFAPAVAKLPVVWDDTIETACTDGECIKWNTKFFDALADQELVTVLCHEAMHCMLGHLWRVPGGSDNPEDWDKWNRATDHAVNLALQEFSDLVQGKRLADPFPFPADFPPLRDPSYKGLSEEVIYARLPKGSGSGSGGSGVSKGGKGGKSSPGGKQQAGIGQIERPAGAKADPAIQKKLLNDWDGTLIQACQLA